MRNCWSFGMQKLMIWFLSKNKLNFEFLFWLIPIDFWPTIQWNLISIDRFDYFGSNAIVVDGAFRLTAKPLRISRPCFLTKSFLKDGCRLFQNDTIESKSSVLARPFHDFGTIWSGMKRPKFCNAFFLRGGRESIFKNRLKTRKKLFN